MAVAADIIVHGTDMCVLVFALYKNHYRDSNAPKPNMAFPLHWLTDWKDKPSLPWQKWGIFNRIILAVLLWMNEKLGRVKGYDMGQKSQAMSA